jgi:hypothetical protein
MQLICLQAEFPISKIQQYIRPPIGRKVNLSNLHLDGRKEILRTSLVHSRPNGEFFMPAAKLIFHWQTDKLRYPTDLLNGRKLSLTTDPAGRGYVRRPVIFILCTTERRTTLKYAMKHKFQMFFLSLINNIASRDSQISCHVAISCCIFPRLNLPPS